VKILFDRVFITNIPKPGLLNERLIKTEKPLLISTPPEDGSSIFVKGRQKTNDLRFPLLRE
jgi:hypothetical protein